MVDDYAGYKALFRDGAVVELGCMAHARRKFFDLAKANQSPIATRALRHLARLYRIEARAAGKTAEARKALLFAGSERAAVIQSLLGTAKLNELDPAAWLKDTLDKLPTWPNSRIDELLPLKRD